MAANGQDDQSLKKMLENAEGGGLSVNEPPQQVVGGEDDDEFDPDAGGGAGPPAARKWLAIACFYSGKPYNVKTLFTDMSRAWGIKDTMEARPLAANRYVLEFDSEQLFKHVTTGGPWRHKGDALIVVPYDGFRRPSEIVVDKIGLWVQFHDVPIHLMTVAFTQVLAKKISMDIVEAVGPVGDFLRVRLMFPLGDSLCNFVEQRVKGHGLLRFKVKYENVPDFCLLCGRIGHGEEDCPEENVSRLVRNFGAWLRPSPVRKDAGNKIRIDPANNKVFRALNFSGQQQQPQQRDDNVVLVASNSNLACVQQQQQALNKATVDKGVQDMYVDKATVALTESLLFNVEAEKDLVHTEKTPLTKIPVFD